MIKSCWYNCLLIEHKLFKNHLRCSCSSYKASMNVYCRALRSRQPRSWEYAPSGPISYLQEAQSPAPAHRGLYIVNNPVALASAVYPAAMARYLLCYCLYGTGTHVLKACLSAYVIHMCAKFGAWMKRSCVVVVMRRGGVLRTLHVGRARSGGAGGAGAFRPWRHGHPARPTFTSSPRRTVPGPFYDSPLYLPL